jgi:PhnB protein
VHGAAKALEFYGAVFGATERMRFPGPGGSIAHAEIQIGDSVVIIEDEDPQRGTSAPPVGGLPGSPVYMYVYVDPFGHGWTIASHLEDVPPDELAKRLAALFG